MRKQKAGAGYQAVTVAGDSSGLIRHDASVWRAECGVQYDVQYDAVHRPNRSQYLA